MKTNRTCHTCKHSEGGNKRECDGVVLFCQNERRVEYMNVVARDNKCLNWERETTKEQAL